MPDIPFDINKYETQLKEKKRRVQEEYETKLQENQAKKAKFFHNEMKRISNLSNENQKTELQKLYKRLNDENAERTAKKRAAEERSRLALYGTKEIKKTEPVPERVIRSSSGRSNPLANYYGSLNHWKNTFGIGGRKLANNRRTIKASRKPKKYSTRRHNRS